MSYRDYDYTEHGRPGRRVRKFEHRAERTAVRVALRIGAWD